MSAPVITLGQVGQPTLTLQTDKLGHNVLSNLHLAVSGVKNKVGKSLLPHHSFKSEN